MSYLRSKPLNCFAVSWRRTPGWTWIGTSAEDDAKITRYVYSLESMPVTADPRVQQVTASIKGRNGGGVRLSAYRLRVTRD